MRHPVRILLAGLLVVGCSSSRASAPATTDPARAETERTQAEQARREQATVPTGEPQGMCPMALDGTTATVQDVPGGVAVVFTNPDDPAELRRRVARMARMHEMHAEHHEGMRGGGMHGGMGGGDMHGGDRPMRMPTADVRVEDVEDGARVVLTPEAPGDLQALREHVRRHADMMGTGRCPIMSGDDEA